MSRSSLSPAVAQALREVAEALAATPSGPASAISKPLIRAFVWETYRGGDAVEAMRLIWFGESSAEAGKSAAEAWAALLMARATQLGVTVPREAGR